MKEVYGKSYGSYWYGGGGDEEGGGVGDGTGCNSWPVGATWGKTLVFRPKVFPKILTSPQTLIMTASAIIPQIMNCLPLAFFSVSWALITYCTTPQMKSTTAMAKIRGISASLIMLTT